MSLEQKIEPFAVDRSKIDPIDIFGDYVRQNAQVVCEEWATRRPFYVEVDGSIELLCTRHEDIMAVYNNPELFSAEIPPIEGYSRYNKTMGVRQLAQMEGEAHARLRRLMSPAFSPRSIRVLSDEITAIVDEMLDEIAKIGGEFDAMKMFADHLIVKSLLSAMFKLNDRQRAVMLRMAEVLAGYSNLRKGQATPESSLEAFEQTSQVIRELISERRANPGVDFISDIIVAREENDALSEQELFDQVFMVCIAALTTTPTTMGGMLLTLYRNPDQLEELKQHPDTTPDAVDECQRHHSHRVVGAFARFATRSLELGGTVIPKHMPVHLSIQAGNYDPILYPDPLKFDIRRKPRNLLAFGVGVHHCMGARLAKLVLTIALQRWISRLPDARLADPAFVPRYGGGAGGRRILALPMLA
jgi:cytochrome P450